MNKDKNMNANQPNPCSPDARARVEAKRAAKVAAAAAEKADSRKVWAVLFPEICGE